MAEKQNNEKLDAPVPNAPPTPDNLSSQVQADMQSLAQQGKLKPVLDAQGAPIPGNFTDTATLFAEGIDIPKIDHSNQPAEKVDRSRTEKHANGSTADIDKDGHLQKLTYENGQGYNYEWSQGQLISIDSFDKEGKAQPWLEKNKDGSWSQLSDGQVFNADLAVNQNGDLSWTYKDTNEYHKAGDTEINRTDGSHTFISKADHSWTTKYPDGQERKLVCDEKNQPCEYWAPKPHSSHWKSSDGLTWHQIGADGKQLNKPPMIGKFTPDNETGGFAFLNLGDKENPHVTAYDSSGAPIKPTGHDTATALVAGMVENYAARITNDAKRLIRPGQFETDSKNQSLSVDDRIAARVLAKLQHDFSASNIKATESSSSDIVTAFLDIAKRAESGDVEANKHIYEAMTNQPDAKETNEDSETT